MTLKNKIGRYEKSINKKNFELIFKKKIKKINFLCMHHYVTSKFLINLELKSCESDFYSYIKDYSEEEKFEIYLRIELYNAGFKKLLE